MGPQDQDCLGDAVNSRTSLHAAGWDVPPEEASTEHWSDRLADRLHPKWDSFSWLTVRALYESINDVFAKGGPTIIRSRRARWVASQRAAGVEGVQPGGPERGTGGFAPDFVVDWTSLARPRFLLVGDPGEADASQYAVVDPLLAVHRGDADGWTEGRVSDFMVIVSDVIYPAGDVNEYVNAFYLPYREYERPIYALPGNHDWYDGLNGFMFNFCAAEPLARVRYRPLTSGLGEQAARLLWRGAARPDRDLLAPWMTERARQAARRPEDPPLAPPPPGEPDLDANAPPPAPSRRPVQPAPYFAIATGPLLIVSIDTGVSGELDAEQGEWLRRVSSRPGPKILLTGKPIWVNNEYHPCPIVWKEGEEDGPQPYGATPTATADDIVRHERNGYLAAIGGDTHNYQRYPVKLRDGRTIQYIVSGGGGAYLSATHTIPKVGPVAGEGPPDVEGFEEAEFRCYPLRGDSLALYTRSAGPLVFKLMLSTPVLILATVAMMFLVLGELGDRRLAIILGSALGAVIVLAAAVGFIVRDKIIAKTTPGSRALLIAGIAGFVALGATAVMLGFGDAETNPAAGIAIGLPFALVAGIVLAYTLRGARPKYAPVLVVFAPLVALLEMFRPPGLDGALAFAAYALLPLAFLLVLLVADRARKSLGLERFLRFQRIAVTVAWSALTLKILADQAEPGLLESRDWLSWTTVVLVATGLLVRLAIPHLTSRPFRPHQTDRSALRDVATSVTGVALIVIALHVLAQVEDGWPAKVTALAFSTFVGVVGALLLLGILGLLHGNVFMLRHLRTGRVDPAFVAEYMADHIGESEPARAVGSTEGESGKLGMIRAVRRLGKAVSEIGESNEPPFYKSFLSVEVEGDVLVIRCYGVTGFSPLPTLEDCVSIPLDRGTLTT